MFQKILIANRGEIACRVIATARRLGVQTAAVYSEIDRQALHVALADEAYAIGPSPAAESYLRLETILDVAKRSRSDAIHPGYGFLAENAAFAQECNDAGIVFIGPSPQAIRAMGSKSAARELMERAGIGLLPGYHGEDQSDEALQSAAERIGYPVLIKPSAGGGGKGMRTVDNGEAFRDALASARREARAAFGDEHMLLERFLNDPRHVEVQVFGDQRGNIVYLFERDCSIQRRHQKVLEEAPAPGLSAELRARMGAVAVEATRAIGYVGAGTVEFLLDDRDEFYFMEMNTRLQVEHPVTEMITGRDLVEWQIRVAEGERLPCGQDDLTINGHAIEARLYAEDPRQDFLPSTGTLTHLRTPPATRNVRVDIGVRVGDEVSIHYDPMIAKLIVWDVDREKAVRRLRQALSDFELTGVTHNLRFLANVAKHPSYLKGDVSTGFIEWYRDELLPETTQANDELLAIASLYVLLTPLNKWTNASQGSGDPSSPWNTTYAWRLNEDSHHVITFINGDEDVPVSVHYRGDGYRLDLPGSEIEVRGQMGPDNTLVADLAGKRTQATVTRSGRELTILTEGTDFRIMLDDPDVRTASRESGDGQLTAPMPGKVVSVYANPNQRVKRGDPLMVLEAMKMEHTIKAPADGTVEKVIFDVGEMVDEGAELLRIKAEA